MINIIQQIKREQKWDYYNSFYSSKMIRNGLTELAEGEVVLEKFLSFRYGTGRVFILVTNKRLIISSANLFSTDVKSIFWNHISDIRHRQGLIYGKIELDLLGENVQLRNFKKRSKKAFQKIMNMFITKENREER